MVTGLPVTVLSGLPGAGSSPGLLGTIVEAARQSSSAGTPRCAFIVPAGSELQVGRLCMGFFYQDFMTC